MLEASKAKADVDLHWVDGPEDEGETSNGAEESLGLAILSGSGSATIECKLVDNHKVGDATKRIPTPLLTISATKGSKETSEDHDHIGNNCHEDFGTAEAGQEAKVQKKEWSSETPVNIACPVDLTIDDLNSVWDVLVLLDLLDFVVGNAITRSHCEVREKGEGGNEGGEDMEETFLLYVD